MGDKRLDVWAEEGGVMLKLTRPDEHHIAIEIINPNAGDPSRDRVIARATMASFRWQRIADYFDRERDERIRKLEEAARAAYAHVIELQDAWIRGALSEHDGLGGTRSNRNDDVLHLITHALGEG